jgi:hypothetical protein
MPDIVCMGRLWARAGEAKVIDKIKRIKPHRRIGIPHYKFLITFCLRDGAMPCRPVAQPPTQS